MSPTEKPWIDLWSRLLSEAEALDQEVKSLTRKAAERRAEAELAYGQICKLRAAAHAATKPTDTQTAGGEET